MKRYIYLTVVACGLLFGAGALRLSRWSAQAAASLSITPITWNVIGLDSNNVNVGPNHFPIGARVCNTGDAPATNVTSAFIWDSANALVNLRPGTLTNFNASPVASLAQGTCHDFYYEVEVTRNASAYDTTRRYHITATADVIGSVSTPTPRELYVEHLISQSRNHVLDVRLNGTSVPNGGTMALVVGQTYTIDLVGSTATNGYEQIESFINFPNTIFQVLSVSTTYTADTSPYVGSPDDKLYGDACRWENDPNSPYYRSCRDVGKAGGGVVVTYQVRVLQVPGAPLVNPEPLSTLLYDFSGSSFHYNDDFGTSARFASVVDPATLTIAKNFSPDPTNVNGVSALTFTITNPNAAAISGVNFSDVFPTSPGAMVVANPTGATINGCGAATFAPVAGAGSISFSNGTVAANSSCTVKVNVTAPTTGTYTNTSNHLFVGATDTGSFATDTLTVNNAPPAPSPVCGFTLAQWNFPAGFSVTSPAPSTDNVPGTPSAKPGDGVTSTAFPDGTDSWGSNGDITTGTTLVFANEEYLEFALDTTGYTGLQLSFDAARKNTPNSPRGVAVYAGTSSLTTDGTEGNGAASDPGTVVYAANSTALPTGTTAFTSFGPLSLPNGTTHVRIYFFNSGNVASGSDGFVDNVTFTGCVPPSPPTISKSFAPSPVAVGGTSTLTFALTNPNAGLALSGVAFNDTLPAGVEVTSGSTAQCGGTLTRTAPSTLAFTGGTLAAGGSCNVTATVTVTTAGPHDNVSGFVSSTEGGTNTGTTGIATASITGILPPGIAKQFAPNPVLAGTPTTLTFTLTNPNASLAQSGVAFSDTFPVAPGAMVVAPAPAATTTGCGSPTFAPMAGSGSISFSGGTIAAGGTCIVTVNVLGPVAGSYANTSGAVSHLVNGVPVNGGTSSDTLNVTPANPAIAFLKQVGPTAAGPWSSFLAAPTGGNVFYRFTVENIGNVPLNSVGVNDPQVSTASCTWPSPLPVASPTNDPTATCVVGPVTAASGTHPNTATASGTNGTTVMDTSTATYATTGLTLAKSVMETSFLMAGDVLHYSFLVTNSGSAALAGPVTVSDNKASDESCPAVNTVGDLDNFLDPGESLTCTATYTVTPGDVTAGFVTNLASATADGATSNTDSKTVFLATSADVSLVKTLTTSGPFTAGQSIAYTLLIANGGPSTATNIQVTDTPTNLTITTVSGSGCAALPCIIASLASGANTTITIMATINAAGAFDNSANATATETDPNTSNNTDNTGNGGTASASADVSLVKTLTTSGPFIVGQSITYTLLIANAGSSTATNLQVTDTPTNLTITNVSGSGCAALPCTIASLASGANTTITVTATINAVGAFDNSATATATEFDPNTSNNTDNTGNNGTAAASADVSIVKTLTTSGPFSVGQSISYTLVVANAGPSTATNIQVTDTPTNLTITNVNGSGCAALPCTIASLASGANTTINVTATITATGAFDNSATATATEFDPNTSNNTDNTGNGGTASASADVSVVKTLTTSGPFTVGQSISYSLVVANAGPSTATNITVTDTPINLTITNVSGSGCTALPCTIASLASGANTTITVTATINAAGAFDNTATATATQFDPNTSNNTDNSGNGGIATASADVSLAKTLTTSGPFTVGQSVSYTLVVANAGPSTATSIQVTDTPTNLTITNVSGSGCAALPCTIASLVSGANTTITVTATINAAGAFDNSATATATEFDPNTSNNTDNTGNGGTATASADVSLVKTLTTSGPFSPGQSISYTLVVANAGPSTATNIQVTDTPTNLTITNVSGSGCAALPCTIASLASGANTTITVTATINASGAFDNSATATATEPDPNTSNNTDNTGNGGTALSAPSIAKAFSPNSILVGGVSTLTFTITNPNAGTSLTGVAFMDSFPSGVQVAATPGASTTGCGAPTFTPAVGNTSVSFSGGTIAASGTCTVTVNVTATTSGAKVNTTGNVTSTNGGTGNTGTDTLTVSPAADLSISKTNGVTSINAGGTTTYTLVVSNAGPSAANGALLTDPAVANLAVTSVNCTNASGGAACPGSGVTVVNLQGGGISVNLPSGSSLTFTVGATVSGNATGNITNTATITAPGGTTDPTPSNNTANDTDTITPVADLSITKTDGVTSVNAGGTTTYTLVISNAGPSTATGALLTDPAVANLIATNVSCTGGTGGAACPGSGVTVANLQGSGISVNLPSGGSLTFSVAATIAGSATGSITNTATISAPGGTSDPSSGNNTASDTDTVTPVADLSITKTDGVTSVNAGGTTTYTLVVSNAGPSAVTGALLTDPVVTNLSVTGVSCSGSSGGAVCPGSGVTVANLQGSGISLNLPAGGSLTFTVSATVAGSATGSITNTATISAPAGTSDPNTGNNSASDTDTVTPVANLSITKTDGVSSVNAGGTTTYTLVVSNAGPSAVTGALLTDPAVANLTVTNVSCGGATGGASCPVSGVTVANLQGSGISVNLPSGGSLSFSVTATVAGGATGSITNTASINPPAGTTDPTPGDNTASDTDNITPVADLSVTKTDGVTSVNAGGTTTYTIVLTNNGSSAANNAVLTDPAASGLNVTSVSCTSAGGGAACPAPPNVTVALLQGAGIVIPTLPSGGSVSFSLSATVTATNGSVTNTATVATPPGVTDPTPSNNSASDTDTVTPIADLSITKTDGVTSVNAGGTTTYTLVISNAGPSAVTGAALTDPAVTNLTVTNVNCSGGTGGATCPASGVTVANLQGSGISLNLPAGGSLTFTVTATVAGSATGNITNTATIAPPNGTIDPTPSNNTASDTDTVTPIADLSVTKTDGVTSVNAGGTTTYTLTVQNSGPSAVGSALLTDPAVTNLTVTGVSCTGGTGGASCPASGVTVANLQGGGISLNLPSGGTLTFTVAATIAGSATGSLTNTATITPPSGTTDPNTSNNSASDTDTIIPVADLSITKTDGVTSVNAGGTTTYTLVISNAGPSAANGALLTDPAVANLTVTSVNCTNASGGAACPGSGVTVANLQGGGISVNLPSGSSLTFTVGATVSGSATGSITNTATIAVPNGTTDPTPSNNTANDTDTVIPVADLSITKTDGVTSVNAGGTTTYTLVISNAGPSTATGALLTDPAVANLAVTNVACTTGTGGASCPGSGVTVANLQGSGISVNLPSGSSLTFTVTATVAGSATGSVTNTATITAPVGTTDPTPANNSASDTDTIIPVADLSITKTDGVASVNAGSTTTYTLVVSNAGPSAVTGATLTDPAVANLTATSVSCGAVTGGAVCPASGVTVANLQGSGIGLNLPASSSMTFTVVATVASSATGSITNTATIAVPIGTTDPTPSNNTASDTDVIGSLADLSITKTDGVSSLLPGSATTYTLVISNSGPSAVTGAVLTDPVVTNLTLTSVSCNSGTGGAVCPVSGVTLANLQGSGISLNLPASASLTFTVAATVASKATGSLTNTATITPPIGTTDPTPSNNSASDTDVVILAPIISKAFGVASMPLGGSTSLSFTITNPASNTVALTGVGFTDTLPAGLVVATPNGSTGSCGGGTITATAGSGSISLSGATLATNSSCTFSVNVTGTTAGVKNNTTSNVTSTNGGQGNTASATITVVAPPTIAKAFASSNILLNGTTGLSFTLTNPNATVALTGVAFNDPLPAGLVVANPANLNGACGGTVTANAGAGTISLTGGTIAASGSCTISVNVTGTTVGTKNNTTNNVTSTNGGQGNTASATLNIGNLSASITDPAICLGPGGIVGVSASVTNGAAVAQSVSITASLPAQLLALPGTCTATTGACTVVNASTVTFSATLAAGQTATINYQAQVANGTPPGTQLCVSSAVSFNGGAPVTVQACTTVNCPPVGPGLPLPVSAPSSDQVAGSVLVYNLYSSSASNANVQNTRISLTNINPVVAANVHLFFLDGTSCSVADQYICLTPNQTVSFLAADIDPGTTGYLVAVAVNRTGCPINFNYLIGDEYVKLATGHAANLGAEAFAALAGSVTPCDVNATEAVLNFDGVSYARAPRTLALDNIADRPSGNDTLLVLNRFGGNLAISASALSAVTGVLYDDAEKGFSFAFNGNGCQLISSLSNNFPRTAPRFDQIIPAGRSGWLKLWLGNEGALLGAAINANRNAQAVANAFNQGHNLHKLTLTPATQLTIPVFPPSC